MHGHTCVCIQVLHSERKIKLYTKNRSCSLFHEHVQWSYFRNAAMQAHTMLLHNQVWVHHVG